MTRSSRTSRAWFSSRWVREKRAARGQRAQWSRSQGTKYAVRFGSGRAPGSDRVVEAALLGVEIARRGGARGWLGLGLELGFGLGARHLGIGALGPGRAPAVTRHDAEQVRDVFDGEDVLAQAEDLMGARESSKWAIVDRTQLGAVAQGQDGVVHVRPATRPPAALPPHLTGSFLLRRLTD